MDWNQQLKLDKDYDEGKDLDAKFFIYNVHEKGTKLDAVLKVIFD